MSWLTEDKVAKIGYLVFVGNVKRYTLFILLQF